jgi:hypothetical protein
MFSNINASKYSASVGEANSTYNPDSIHIHSLYQSQNGLLNNCGAPYIEIIVKVYGRESPTIKALKSALLHPTCGAGGYPTISTFILM